MSLDESVWFDHFFSPVICPLFYVETLADLVKEKTRGRSPEQEVSIIAEKFPEMHGTPTAQHVNACIGELFGHRVPMTGQVLVAGGRPVKAEGKTGVVFEESDESKAFTRWQSGQYEEIEHEQAAAWRTMVTNLDLDEMKSRFRKLGIDGKSCKTLNDAYSLAEEIVNSTDKPFDRMYLAILFLDIQPQYHRDILTRWSEMNYPPLTRYAPYVAYVYKVELFFQITLAANLISSNRPSNRVDIGYLFYLPFSMAFVSSDKLHKKCAPLFLRKNQKFFWGPDLKNILKEANEHYMGLPQEEKDKGVMSFAGDPPKGVELGISDIWDEFFPGWRDKKQVDLSDPKVKHTELLEHVKKFRDAPAIPQDEVDFDFDQADSVTLTRMVKKSKGSWYQVPKDLKDEK